MTTPQTASAAKLDFGARIDAINAALQGLAALDPEADRTLRALAHTTEEQANSSQWAEIRSVAERLVFANENQLVAVATELVARLREAAAAQRSDSPILVIGGDSAFTATLATALANSGRQVVHAPTGAEARRLLKEPSPVCVILHVVLPDLDGRTLLTRLRESPMTASIPVLLLGDRLDDSLKEESRLHAADGFMEQPRDAVAVSEWILGRLRRGPESAKAARRDGVTGLLNRAAFREYFSRIQQECAAAKEPLVLATISVAGVREVLQNFNADAREEVLQSFGLVLSNSLRTTDVLARTGMFEFAALFPGEDHAGGTRAVDKIIEKIKDRMFRTSTGETIALSLAAGITLVNPNDSLDDAVAAADHFVYQATVKGGNQVASAGAPQVASRHPRILLMIRDPMTTQVLQQMLEKNGFHVSRLDHWSPETAGDIARQHHHLVVVDEGFPPAGGLDVVKSLRQDPQNSRTPIIMLVAVNAEATIARALEYGANDYIVRPFSPLAFISRTHRLLSRGVGAPGTSACRILVVSDDIATLVMSGTALQQRGEFEVLLARGGKDGIDRVLVDAPDVLLVDAPIANLGTRPFWPTLAEKAGHASMSIVVAEIPPPAGVAPHAYPVTLRGRIAKPLSPLKLGTEIESILGLTPKPHRDVEAQQRLNEEIRRITKKESPAAS